MIDDDSPKKKSEKKSEIKKVPPNHALKKDSETVNNVDAKPVNSVDRTNLYPPAKFVNNKRESQVLLDNRKLRDVLYKEVRRPGRSELL